MCVGTNLYIDSASTWACETLSNLTARNKALQLHGKNDFSELHFLQTTKSHKAKHP